MNNQKGFKKFKLHNDILHQLSENNFTQPTPVQSESIPVILRNADLKAIAQTGSGKTAAYLLPIIHKLITKKRTTSLPLALVVVPTRELAAQVNSQAKFLSPLNTIKSVPIYGGVKLTPQLDKINKGCDIIAATPGRLIDICKNHNSKLLSKIKYLVVDEADKILDMGFSLQLHDILSILPRNRQNMLFSATFSRPLQKIASKMLTRPTNIEIEDTVSTQNDIKEKLYHLNDELKASFCFHYIVKQKVSQALVFCRTKATVDNLSKYLGEKGIPSAALHSDKLQAQRLKTLNNFKNGRCRILVATDIAARGIDVINLPLVINYELPIRAEDYIHRIGRTGRAGKSGEAISFISTPEMPLLIQVEGITGRKINREKKPYFKTDGKHIASPVPNINLKTGRETRTSHTNKKNLQKHKIKNNNK